jgi:hypothetical protein
MERVTKRSGRLSRLFNVLVAGGIALAAGCATTQSGSKPDKPDDGSASSQPSSPGGVRGW